MRIYDLEKILLICFDKSNCLLNCNFVCKFLLYRYWTKNIYLWWHKSRLTNSNRAIREFDRGCESYFSAAHTRPQGDHYPCVNVRSLDFNVSDRWRLYDSSFPSDFMRVTVASLSYRFVSDRFHLASSPRRERSELSRSRNYRRHICFCRTY